MRRAVVCLLAVAAAALNACSKEDLPSVPSVDSLKQAVTDQVENVKQTVDAAGNVQLQLDSPLTTSGCYGKLLTLGGGRPAVFTVSSYNAAANESFPSFMLQAQTTAADAAGLTAAPLAAVAFVQESKDGPIWQSKADSPVQVTVASAADGQMTGQISGSLLNVETGAEKQFSGTFSGSFSNGAR